MMWSYQIDIDLVWEALGLMAVGMTVVFSGLVLLMLSIVVLNRVSGQDPAPVAKKSAPVGKPGQVDPQMIAVLTAAAATALNRPVQVRSARTAQDSMSQGSTSTDLTR